MRKLLICLGAAVLVLSGCLSVSWRSSFVQPASLSNAAGKEYTVVGHFRRDVRIFFTIDGLVAITNANEELDKALKEEVQRYHGDGVVNLAIKDELGTTDWLISAGLSVLGGLAGALYVGTSTSSYGYSSSGPDQGVIYAGTAIALIPAIALQSRTVTIEGDIFQFK